MKYKPVNINSMVKVKLTDVGRKIHEAYFPNIEIDVDEDGYTKFQVWRLMNIFGQWLTIGGGEHPFDLEILVEVDE